MPTCAAKGCTNSSAKGVKLSNFPRDPERRKKWVTNCELLGGMTNCSLTDKAVLCEYHFTSDMWEKPRVDGKKKLKCSAVPVIFGDLVHQAKRESTKNVKNQNSTTSQINTQVLSAEKQDISSQSCENGNNEQIIDYESTDVLYKFENLKEEGGETVEESYRQLIESCTSEDISQVEPQHRTEILFDHMYCITERKEKSHNSANSKNYIDQLNQDNSIDIEIHYNENITDDNSTNSDDDLIQEENSLLSLQNEMEAIVHSSDMSKKFDTLLKLYTKSERLRKAMKTRHNKKQRAAKNLINKLKNDLEIARENNPGIYTILNDDQLQLLNKKHKKLRRWCDSTLDKANQLKFSCGVSGYKELLKQNYPLPSLRTLRRKL